MRRPTLIPTAVELASGCGRRKIDEGTDGAANTVFVDDVVVVVGAVVSSAVSMVFVVVDSVGCDVPLVVATVVVDASVWWFCCCCC